MQRMLLTLAGFMLLLLPGGVQAKSACRIAYTSNSKLALLDVEAGTSQTLDLEGSLAEDVLVSPDGRWIAVYMEDIGHEITGLAERLGTKIVDLSRQPISITDTREYYWPEQWSHKSDKLLLRNPIDDIGVYELYMPRTKTAMDLAIPITRIPGSAPYNSEQNINIFRESIQWSPNDRYLAATADERPFPQDRNGWYAGVYVVGIGGLVQQVSRRESIEAWFYGWLANGTVLYKQLQESSYQLIAATADAKQQKILQNDFNGEISISPKGSKFIFTVPGSSQQGNAEKKTVNYIFDVASGEYHQLNGVNASNPYFMRWSRDETQFAYLRDVSDQVEVDILNVATQISTPVEFQQSNDITDFKWSADGKLLLVVSSSHAYRLVVYDPGAQTFQEITAPSDTQVSAYVAWVCTS